MTDRPAPTAGVYPEVAPQPTSRASRSAILRAVGGRGHVLRPRSPSARTDRRHRVRVLRRAAVRQRPAALRAPADRLRQGRRAALPDDAGRRRASPLRLGLPRPAGRGGGREGARHRRPPGDHGVRHRQVQRGLPDQRAALHRRVASATSPARPAGSTSTTTTRRSTSTTWRASCGPSSRCGTRAWSTRASACWPTAGAARPRCATPRRGWTTSTGTARTRRSPSPSS